MKHECHCLNKKNPYLPKIMRIKKIVDESYDVKTFILGSKMNFIPGQFVEISVPGIGEAPFSVSSWPELEITVRNVGNVTKAMFNLKRGCRLGVRGPFGNGWPIEDITQHLKNDGELIFSTGGCGIAVVKPVIDMLMKKRLAGKNVKIFFGARNPEQILFKKQFIKWSKILDVYLTIDKPAKGWKGRVGFVSDILKKEKIDKDAIGYVCGPPIMMKLSYHVMKSKGMKDENIYMSLERLMDCGMGKCGHCNIGDKFVCIDGPIFKMSEIPFE